MLRPDKSSIDSNHSGQNTPVNTYDDDTGGVDIQQELNRLEEIILDSPRIPLTRRTLVDEEKLLDQLDLVRLSLPAAFAEAEAIVQHKEDIILQVEEYGHKLVEAAEQRAAEILDETGIIQQAQREADMIRRQVQQECEAMHTETIAEIDRLRRQAHQEFEQLRRQALADAQEIQQGAEEYAYRMLGNIEQQLNDMLRVVRNGRQQLNSDPVPPERNPPPGKKKKEL
ncbi:MAG: DivIVA domain-containing protein [Nostocaceae cyanobacterium]|nr:DivIVA domain-containing protein [Nostocaceae cyanobacterium]